MGNKDTSSLAHTTYECKYHIVFTPKYRRQVIYGKIRADIGKYCGSYVSTKVWRLSKRKRAKITSICSFRYHRSTVYLKSWAISRERVAS